MARKPRVITMSPLDDVSMVENNDADLDLSYWELVNSSDADYSDDSLSVVSWDEDDSLSSSPSPRKNGKDHVVDDGDTRHDVCFDGVNDGGDGNNHQVLLDGFFSRGAVAGFVESYCLGDDDGDGDDNGEVDDDGDGDGDDDGYDLDDELVPWSVSGKLGRQRMRKLGKRAFSKVVSSKRSPFSHVKPGCLYGKHGLGTKYLC